jgi:hypothetical protein
MCVPVQTCREAAYLTVSKDYKDARVSAGYAFKEEVALVEIRHKPDNEDLPDVRYGRSLVALESHSAPYCGACSKFCPTC